MGCRQTGSDPEAGFWEIGRTPSTWMINAVTGEVELEFGGWIGRASKLTDAATSPRGCKTPRAQRFFDQPLLRSVKRKNSDCLATGAARLLSAIIWD